MFQTAEPFFLNFFFNCCYLCQLLTVKTCPHGNFAVIGIVCFTATVKPVLNGLPVKWSPYNRWTLAAKFNYLLLHNYRKIPKISPGAYIFQRPFLRGLFVEGLYSEGLMYGGIFAFQN